MEPKFAQRVEWELTRGCDLRCGHCYNTPHHARPRELETEEALAVAADLGRLGCRAVTLSGGEPTRRFDWPQIAQGLARAGIVVQLVTHGQRFGRTEARLARAAGVGAVHLSVDGLAPTHDRLRGRAGAFQQLDVAATGLTDAEVPLGFVTTVLGANVGQLEDLAPWVSRWDPISWQLWLGLPQPGRAGWLPPAALPALARRLAALQKRFPFLTVGDNVGLGGNHCGLRRTDDLDPAPEATAGGSPAPDGHCEAGRSMLGLRADGTVTGCLHLPGAQGVGNVRHTPLPQLWHAARAARRQRLTQLTGACGGCARVDQCLGGCHAMALAATGILDNPYCLSHPETAAVRPGRRAAGVAASLAVAAALTGGCGPREAPREARRAPAPAAAQDASAPADPLARDAAAPTPGDRLDASARRPRPRARPPLPTYPPGHGRRQPCFYSHVGCFHLRHRPARRPTPAKGKP